MKHLVAMTLCIGVAACGQDMDSQPSYREYEPAALFRDGRVLQVPVEGTVARGDIARAAQASEKPPLTETLIRRGQREFDVYCSPCHGRTGAGDGIVVRRGMPRPASLHIDRLRTAPDQDFFKVISAGYGAMYSYAARIKPRERWAIIAYIRALQTSQHARLDDVPEQERERLRGEAQP